MPNIKDGIKRASDFVKEDIWRIRLEDTSGKKSFFIRQLRVVILALSGFFEDKCVLRASALTYYTLLAVVPVMAVAFGIAKGFGLEHALETEILNRFANHEPTVTRIVIFAHNLLNDTKGSTIAGVGIILLLWSVVKTLGQVELSLNEIWETTKHRSLHRKLTNYLSIMLIAPILIIMSGSSTVVIKAWIAKLGTAATAAGGAVAAEPIMFLVLKLIPYVITWMVFSFIYIVVPNTTVRIRSAVIAALVASIAYQALQWAYITFQVMAVKYNAIYGSFAALPLFLMWLHMSWLIVLFGAELSFAEQNADTYEFEPDTEKTSSRFRRIAALVIVNRVTENFIKAMKPLSAHEIAKETGLPIRFTKLVLTELTEAGVLIGYTPDEDDDECYMPARDINSITIGSIADALDRRGVNKLHIKTSPELREIEAALEAFHGTIEKSPSNKLIKDI
ncbi:MAG: YihY/virulence factor BrkB family protein [Deltaproteobacteria bacterium]|nr:YihY/virulence factor BrkB family protein [Deltaproteobacteria bacterium]